MHDEGASHSPSGPSNSQHMVFSRTAGSGEGTALADSSPPQNVTHPAPSARASPPNITSAQASESTSITKEEVVGSIRKVLDVVEKALDGVPIPGAKAAVGATAAILKNVEVNILRLVNGFDSLPDLKVHWGNKGVFDSLRARLQDLEEDLQECIDEQKEQAPDAARLSRDLLL